MTTLNVHHPRSHHEDGIMFVREDHQHFKSLFAKFRCGARRRRRRPACAWGRRRPACRRETPDARARLDIVDQVIRDISLHASAEERCAASAARPAAMTHRARPAYWAPQRHLPLLPRPTPPAQVPVPADQQPHGHRARLGGGRHLCAVRPLGAPGRPGALAGWIGADGWVGGSGWVDGWIDGAAPTSTPPAPPRPAPPRPAPAARAQVNKQMLGWLERHRPSPEAAGAVLQLYWDTFLKLAELEEEHMAAEERLVLDKLQGMLSRVRAWAARSRPGRHGAAGLPGPESGPDEAAGRAQQCTGCGCWDCTAAAQQGPTRRPHSHWQHLARPATSTHARRPLHA
jgi:hypothetical protein